MIQLENIEKSFGDKKILKGISTTFEQGKTNLIIGKSGSGKTVMLKSIVGLHRIDKGTILFDGENFQNSSFKELQKHRQEIGMTFQGGALFDSMTIEENVRFPLDMFTTWGKAEKKKRVDECLAMVELSGSNKRRTSEISGGMQKRVAIARAISLGPKYLFCDEPNSGLDPITSIVIDKLIHSLTQELGMTTVINTHDMNSVMEIGENIIFVSEGKIEWRGNSQDIFNSTNEALNNFIFASPLFRKIRNANR